MRLATGSEAHLRPVLVQIRGRIGVGKGSNVGVPLQGVLQVACPHIVPTTCRPWKHTRERGVPGTPDCSEGCSQEVTAQRLLGGISQVGHKAHLFAGEPQAADITWHTSHARNSGAASRMQSSNGSAHGQPVSKPTPHHVCTDAWEESVSHRPLWSKQRSGCRAGTGCSRRPCLRCS